MKEILIKDGRVMKIRSIKIEDAEQMVDYLNKVAGESDNLTFGKGEINITVEKERVIIGDNLGASGSLFIVGEVDGKIASVLNFNAGRRLRVRHAGEFGISVQKDYWNLGIGKEMIKYMIEWAKNSGVIRKINLRVRSDNEKAIKLYTSLGFKEEGVLTRDFIINGVFYDSIAMGLFID